MSLNTANTPDGRGVLIYNGEMILLYIKEVNLAFDKYTQSEFKGKKHGNLYLTSHRIIFINNNGSDSLHSFSIPFLSFEKPEPGGNWTGEVTWKLTFNKGGCIDFGQALLKANDMANSSRPHNAPPQYAPPAGAYYSPPPAYYMAQNGNYNGFQAPVHASLTSHQPKMVYVRATTTICSPKSLLVKKSRIGPDQPPHQLSATAPMYPSLNNPSAPQPNASGQYPNASAPAPYPAVPPSYDQATALPQKI
uniref:Vacuolar protein-sorting-associated protein 36 n=1 Tax=Ditylenchus dipsaci TaxID=166011 RepID=A0A915DC28_9BILA